MDDDLAVKPSALKGAIGWILLLMVIVGGAGAGLYHFYQGTEERDYRLRLMELKRDFLTDTGGLFYVSADDYRREVGPLLNKYFRALGKLSKAYPELYDIEREAKRGERELLKGHMTEIQKLQRDERIDITLDLFKRMRDGHYRPLYTFADKGFRFDIYDITPAKVSGEHKIKLSYVHWGPYPRGHRPGSGPIKYMSIDGNIKAEKKKGRPAEVPKIVGEAQPPNLQIAPAYWVNEFPPGVEIGYYDLPQFPRHAKSIELSFRFGVVTIGGSELVSNITFPEIGIPESWKVPEGQRWEANERLASDEELQAAGVSPTQTP